MGCGGSWEGAVEGSVVLNLAGHVAMLSSPQMARELRQETWDGRLTDLKVLESCGRQIAGSLRSNWEKGWGWRGTEKDEASVVAAKRAWVTRQLVVSNRSERRYQYCYRDRRLSMVQDVVPVTNIRYDLLDQRLVGLDAKIDDWTGKEKGPATEAEQRLEMGGVEEVDDDNCRTN